MNKISKLLLRKSISNSLGKFQAVTGWPCVRHYLSSSYKCEHIWQERLESPVLKDIDVGNFAVRLQEKLDKDGQIPSIDMDIFANKLELLDPYQLDFAENIFSRFRHTAHTGTARASMSHAVVRALLKMNETERLLYILNDKVKYGIFLDQYSANMCMMDLLGGGAYLEAGLVAAELMLMEEFGSDLNTLMSIYSCHMALQQTTQEKLAEELNPSDPEPDEEEWVKVKFIINPWYDDHWDLPTAAHRLGKTLAMATQHADFTQDKLSASLQLIGLAHWQKFQSGVELLQTVASSDGKISTEAFDQFSSLLNSVCVEEGGEVEIGLRRLHHVRPRITEEEKAGLVERVSRLRAQLQSTDQLQTQDITAEITMRLDAARRLEEGEHISSIQALYQQWDEERNSLFEQYKEDIMKQKKKINIASRLKRLTEIEEKLSFFSEQGQIGLGVARAEKIRARVEVKEIAEEEQFVPPPQERGKAF